MELPCIASAKASPMLPSSSAEDFGALSLGARPLAGVETFAAAAGGRVGASAVAPAKDLCVKIVLGPVGVLPPLARISMDKPVVSLFHSSVLVPYKVISSMGAADVSALGGADSALPAKGLGLSPCGFTLSVGVPLVSSMVLGLGVALKNKNGGSSGSSSGAVPVLGSPMPCDFASTGGHGSFRALFPEVEGSIPCIKLPVRPSAPLPSALPPPVVVCRPEVLENKVYYKDHRVVCRFNNLWPSLLDLHRWVLESWKPLVVGKIELFPCARGFFVVAFVSPKERDYVLNGRVWLWGVPSLFIKPWDCSFNPLREPLNIMPTWVRLPNLPLQCWEDSCYEDIGNAIGWCAFCG